MSSTQFTTQTLAEMRARGDVAVTVGDLECPTLAAAVAELDAIDARRVGISAEAMRQYRAGERTEARKALCFAPARIAERLLTEARNAVCRAYGVAEWHPETV